MRTIGRATGADFIVDAALVSRVHCRLTALPDGELEVRDLESTNGTYVNGDARRQCALAPGDRVQVGRVELVRERTRTTRTEEMQSDVLTRRTSIRRSALSGGIPLAPACEILEHERDSSVRSRPIVVSGPCPG